MKQADTHGTRTKANDIIAPQALAILMIVSLVDLNFLGAPQPIIKVARADAWMSVLGSATISVFTVWIYFSLLRRHPSETLVEMSRRVFGRWVTIAIVVAYVLYWLATATIMVKLQTHLFVRSLLPNTPPMALNIYIVGLGLYLARHGIEPMARLFQVIIVPFLFLFVPVAAFSINRTDFERLLPVLEQGVIPVLKGAWVTYGSVHGLEFLLLMGPVVHIGRTALKATLVGVGLVTFPALVVGIFLVARFGVDTVINLAWPTLTFIGSIQLPGFSGLRLDPIFLSLWSTLVFGGCSIRLYLIGVALQRSFRLEDIKWSVTTVGIVLIIMTAIPVSPVQLGGILAEWMKWVTPVFTLLIPLILLVAGAFRRLGTTQPALNKDLPEGTP